jgi:hypothetical protein
MSKIIVLILISAWFVIYKKNMSSIKKRLAKKSVFIEWEKEGISYFLICLIRFS